ncbi:hypothetical protein GQX74_007185 [Glossina fuscipes]|nr:hypothetical protein GQX74_007185 [Glossina fuscipes]
MNSHNSKFNALLYLFLIDCTICSLLLKNPSGKEIIACYTTIANLRPNQDQQDVPVKYSSFILIITFFVAPFSDAIVLVSQESHKSTDWKNKDNMKCVTTPQTLYTLEWIASDLLSDLLNLGDVLAECISDVEFVST